MEFNKEQQVAIDTIDKNVCVVAGAGTGKKADCKRVQVTLAFTQR